MDRMITFPLARSLLRHLDNFQFHLTAQYEIVAFSPLKVHAMKRLQLLTAGVWLVSLTLTVIPQPVATQSSAAEAPTGFDNISNGFLDPDEFDDLREDFIEQESIGDGLGPVYNAQSCGECHQSPVTGGISQITELRAGRYTPGGGFVDHPGGSLVHSRAIDASLQEHMMADDNVRSFRTSLNTLGDGFVECIDSNTLIAIAAEQAVQTNGQIRGEVVMVPVLEADGALSVGRFGWKSQHASLLSFSADAYLNEMGITSPLQPTENTSNGRSVDAFDAAPDPEDVADLLDELKRFGKDVMGFARFMRASKAPPRDHDLAATPEAQVGEQIFSQIGCSICHRPSMTTAPPETVIHGGTFTVPDALGNKIIHPFSDFLLHDIGTGDGIVQNGGESTANKMRTAPLWGLRTHERLMHDGLSFTLREAILRHQGEASHVTSRFKALKGAEERALLIFLSSL
jgi:CxxC motif-containing protein (DUF1111 family)